MRKRWIIPSLFYVTLCLFLNNLIVWEGVRNLFKYIDCIDATTDYCPCSLAEVGECLICTQLQDNCFCDCSNYSGTCIYQEYIWNNEKGEKLRQYKIATIKSKKYLREDIILFEINLTNGLTRELNNIGAFVFLKKPGDFEGCSVPISILDSNIYNNTITVAIKTVGVKTKMLCKCEDVIMVKGPYWNGIQGQRSLKEIKNENCLIIGRGIALAPAIMAAKKIIKKNNCVYALLEKGRSNTNYFKTYFDDLNCITENINLMNRDNVLTQEGKVLIKSYLEEKDIKMVLCAGNDVFHKKIITYVYNLDNRIKFATVNNSTMCCGEGQCGSCIIENKNNTKIRACKQQYNPIEVFLEKGAVE